MARYSSKTAGYLVSVYFSHSTVKTFHIDVLKQLLDLSQINIITILMKHFVLPHYVCYCFLASLTAGVASIADDN